MSNNIEYKENKENKENNQNKENFNMKDAKNICHYSCSKLTITNLFLFVIILLLFGMLFR
jgi:hypothetical protein